METSERQLFRARFAWLCKWLLSDVYGGHRFTVNLVCLPAIFEFFFLNYRLISLPILFICVLVFLSSC